MFIPHTESFNIEGNPLDRGNAYLLIQTFDVEYNLHRIFINEQALPSFDIPKHSKKDIYTTWMDRVPQSFLQSGDRLVRIRWQTTTSYINKRTSFTIFSIVNFTEVLG